MDYAVIMAGGTGKRLWPLSRKKHPKQVLRLLEGKTLLGSCFDRLRPIFDPDRILVLTNADYVDLIRKDLPELPADHVIAEPAVRDTCGCRRGHAVICYIGCCAGHAFAPMIVSQAHGLAEPA